MTVQCADGLPAEVMNRLVEVERNTAGIMPRSAQFLALQREKFRTLEKYLDSGYGSCPLRRSDIADIVVQEFSPLEEFGVCVPHYSVMPNHCHALLEPHAPGFSLAAVMKRLKGRSGKKIRSALGGSGAVWQGEWFDRWVRDDSEWKKFADYIRDDPVKAGIASRVGEHPWTC